MLNLLRSSNYLRLEAVQGYKTMTNHQATITKQLPITNVLMTKTIGYCGLVIGNWSDRRERL